MKARVFFRENGTVIHTRSSILDRLRPWVLAFVVALVVLVLPPLLDPPPLEEHVAPEQLQALREELVALEHAARREITVQALHAYQQGQADARAAAALACARGGQL